MCIAEMPYNSRTRWQQCVAKAGALSDAVRSIAATLCCSLTIEIVPAKHGGDRVGRMAETPR